MRDEQLGIVIDTSFVIDLLQTDRPALRKAEEIEKRRDPIYLPTPVLYEISAGLLFTKSRTEAAAFHRIVSRFPLLNFDESAALSAAEIRAEFMRLDRPRSHADTMIAGIALAGSHTLISRDRDLASIADVIGLDAESY